MEEKLYRMEALGSTELAQSLPDKASDEKTIGILPVFPVRVRR